MRSAWRATAAPARSTSTDSGVPAAIARRSASPISAGVRTGFISAPVVGEPDDGFGEEIDEIDGAEHVVAHHRFGFRHLVGDGLVAAAVALEHAPGGVARQPFVEP